MIVKPLAFDSMGVRSMATYVETRDVSIVIDPSVALAPRRFGLPPHSVELDKMRELARVVEEHAFKAKVIIVTHYHYDHHDLGSKVSTEIYKGKTVLIKHPSENINKSQGRVRAPKFLKAIEGKPKELVYADGEKLRFGSTKIVFSEAVPHGTNDRLGYVLEVAVIEGEEVFLYSSDVEGPVLKEQVEFLLDVDPTIAYIDGPMTYMLGKKYSEEDLKRAVRNLLKVLGETRVRKLVLDHHFARDLNCWDYLRLVVDAAEDRGVRLSFAAEEAGVKVNMLEARRKELWEKNRCST